MVKKLLSLLVLFLGIQGVIFAQTTGELKGVVLYDDGRPFELGGVLVYKDGIQVRGGSIDFDGEYWIKNIPVGTYDVTIQGPGDVKKQIRSVRIEGGRITVLDVKDMSENVKLMDAVVVKGTPLIRPDETKQGDVLDRNTLTKGNPARDAIGATKLVGGVVSIDGEKGSVRGSRQGATVIIDGVKMRAGSTNLPQPAVEETQVILGGVPARYGDAVGGIIEITTRTISPRYFGQIEGRSSAGLDKWNDYLFSAAFGGPIAMSKKESKLNGAPIAGFIASVEGRYQGEPRPMAGGVYQITPTAYDALLANPIILAPYPETGTRLSSLYLTSESFRKSATRNNVASQQLYGQGKIDVSLSPQTTLSVGGMFAISRNKVGEFANNLMNWQYNGTQDNVSWNVYGRITHSFKIKDSVNNKPNIIKKAQVSLQVDYVRAFGKIYSDLHRDNLFGYGYVGKFESHRAPFYSFETDSATGLPAYTYQGMGDTLVSFTPAGSNTLLSNYTSSYFNLLTPDQGYRQLSQLQSSTSGVVLNGQTVGSVYSLWNNVGSVYNSYGYSQSDQFRLMAEGGVTIKNHDLQFGFEFEQKVDRSYDVSPRSLWTRARQSANSHLQGRDTKNPILMYDANGNFNDTIFYNQLYIPDPLRPGFGEGQTVFDYNLRKKLGLPVDGLDYIQVDMLNPDDLDITMYSVDELFNGGNILVSYYGYDAYGRKAGNSTFADFFQSTDEYGEKTRPMAPFQPIYMAGYIMDKFSFKDMFFNIGFRIDRYDANQQVLKDPFSLYQARTAGDVNQIGGSNISHPGNIGKDYVVYVDDETNPTAITGYRDGSTWYDNTGAVLNSGNSLQVNGLVKPYLVNPGDATGENSGVSGNFDPSTSFKDYSPQINILPRISFSFPISEKTQFTAYYDVLTQRPLAGLNRLNPLNYLFWDNPSYTADYRYFSNPSLQPERTTDFSLSFRQQIGERSLIKIAAFYKEMRNQIAVVRYTNAYPADYYTYDNIDFGTVKGVTLEYQMRTKNITMSAAYTLQFADGTGSSETSQLGLVNSNQPNLRVTMPIDLDRRHGITGYFIFDFGDNKNKDPYNQNYIGPKGKVGEAIFRNLGFTVNLYGGSGVPYSRQQFATPLTGGGSPALLGMLNGSRLPWQFNVDFMVWKDFTVVWAKEKEKNGKKIAAKKSNLQIYINVENIFNNRNVLSVYRFTGSATDDGYLASALGVQTVASQSAPDAYTNYYNMSMNDPRRISLPRRARIGITLSF